MEQEENKDMGSDQEKEKEPEVLRPTEKFEQRDSDNIKEVHHHHYKDKKRGYNFGRFLFGIFVVIVGLSFLASTMGWINWGISDFAKLWPILIVIVGISILSFRGWLGALIGLIVSIIVIVVIFVLILGSINFSIPNFGNLNKLYNLNSINSLDNDIQCNINSCAQNIEKDWKKFTDSDSGLSFQYPENLLAQYINKVDWPPKIQVENKDFACSDAGVIGGRTGNAEKKTINGKEYCKTKVSEATAGTIYDQYAYAFVKDGKIITFTFTLKSVQCGNYDDTQKTACETERQNFDLDNLIDKIAQTLK